MLFDLFAFSHFWDVLTDSPREEIAALAIEMVLITSFLSTFTPALSTALYALTCPCHGNL